MNLRHELRPDHLLVIADGPFSAAAAKAGLTTIVRACEAAGLARILVDGRGITTPVSIADRYELASQLAAHSQGRVRMAIVVSTMHMFTKTLEDTARNRGVPLRTTDSMREAREFLQLQDE